MTLPDERFRAVRYARQFLYDLCDPAKTPGVPKIIREQARGILRHYPDDWNMQQAAAAAPDVFAERMEPVTRLLRQWEDSPKRKTLTLPKKSQE